MRISARADYAVRAALQLAVSDEGGPLKAEAIAEAQDIPHKFLEGILNDMRRGGLVVSRRGGNGGYRLARPALSITIADVVRVADGPLVSVRGVRPPDLSYSGPAVSLLPLWIALRSNVREILEGVSLADVASASLPPHVTALTDAPGAWTNPSRPTAGADRETSARPADVSAADARAGARPEERTDRAGPRGGGGPPAQPTP